MCLALYPKKKEISCKFCPGKFSVWMVVWPGRSVVTQCTCWYFAIDKNRNFGAHKILLSGTALGAVLGDLAR